jgi:hypothetical protein
LSVLIASHHYSLLYVRVKSAEQILMKLDDAFPGGRKVLSDQYFKPPTK